MTDTPDPAADFRAQLAAAALSQCAAARALDLGDRTIRRYCAGDSPVPRCVIYALHWLRYLRQSQEGSTDG